MEVTTCERCKKTEGQIFDVELYNGGAAMLCESCAELDRCPICEEEGCMGICEMAATDTCRSAFELAVHLMKVRPEVDWTYNEILRRMNS